MAVGAQATKALELLAQKMESSGQAGAGSGEGGEAAALGALAATLQLESGQAEEEGEEGGATAVRATSRGDLTKPGSKKRFAEVVRIESCRPTENSLVPTHCRTSKRLVPIEPSLSGQLD